MITLRRKFESLIDHARRAGGGITAATVVPDPERAVPLRLFHLDQCGSHGWMGHIEGWALVPEWDPQSTEVLIELLGPASYLLQTSRASRPDVAHAHRDREELASSNCLPGIDACGFRVSFTLKTLLNGEYRPRIWVLKGNRFAVGTADVRLLVGATTPQETTTCE